MTPLSETISTTVLCACQRQRS